MKNKKAAGKPVPFTIDGYPVDRLDQEQLQWVKRMADEAGVSVEQILEVAVKNYARQFFASLDPGGKVVKFPKARGRKS